jgi:hypothetical protein
MILYAFFQLPFVHDIVCLCQFSFGHVIVCLLSVSLWLKKDRPYHGQRETDKRQTITWPKENWQKTDNNMAKGKLKKDRQYRGQRQTDIRQTITWPKENWQKTDNIMDKGKLTKGLSFVSFPLAMLLSVFCQFPFGHDIVCLLSVFLWP